MIDKPDKKLTLSNYILDSIELAMNSSDAEGQWYLDTGEGETLFISENYIEDEELENAIENDTSGRYILVPPKSSRENWEQMDRFTMLPDIDEENRGRLLNAISGRGAFSRFKDELFRMGILEKWYVYKGREDRKEALEWLREEELIEDSDIARGLELYEDWLHAKRKREADLTKMNTGAMVRCTYNSGHEGKITPGRIYEILEERNENLLIKIKDNNGNNKWYPKSHFELLPLRKA
ncbi:MAG: hypothetical protein JXB00_20915 [Bacteroidales bacterium]|nr:hypothetical protein [Bacteroidales bacterium]